MEPRKNLQALTVARFYAALGVLLFHFAPLPTLMPIQNAIANGYVGVQFFFMLSGFILTYVALGRPLNLRAYAIRRFARIYPVYAFAGILTAFVMLTDVQFALPYFSMLQAWIPGMARQWNLPGWSISCEAFFYAAFPLVLFQLTKMSTRALCVVAGVLVVLAAAKYQCVYWICDTRIMRGTALEVRLADYVSQFPPLAICTFLLGATIAHMHARGLRLHAWLAWPAIAMSIGIMSLKGYGSVLGIPILTPLTPIFSIIILALADSDYRWSRSSLLLGNSSYSLYILQFPIHASFVRFVALDTWPKVALFCLFTIGCSVITYLCIERPAEKWINERFGGRRSSAVGVSAATL